MYNEIIKLVAETKTINEFGDTETEYTENEVFAEIKSITQTETYQAMAQDLKPELKFVLADFYDYNNEKIVKYTQFDTEEEYSVIRTYRTNNELEIVVKKGIF